SRLMRLPTCDLPRLGKIADLVTSARLSRICKERLVWALKDKDYIPKLLELFQVCENTENTEGLRLLFDIMRGILYLDKAILFEVMFSDECILGVVGCLEYNPGSAHPGLHREFLTKIANLQEVFPIRDPELRQKIRMIFRAQYIQEIILPNLPDFEEGFLSNLNSFINSMKQEILRGLQKEDEFLSSVFAQLTDEATADEKRCQLMKFLREFCAFSLTSPEKRDEFLQTLAKLRIFPTLEILMGVDDLQVRSAAADILSYLTVFSPATVYEFLIQEAQQSQNDTQLLTVLFKQLIHSPSHEFGENNQLMEILRALLDPDKMLATASYLDVFGFLDVFYDRYINVLTAPLPADTSEKYCDIGNDNFNYFPFEGPYSIDFLADKYQTAEILASVLQLLSFCVERHKYHMRVYVLNKDLLRRILMFLKSKHKFLALCALRFMRRIIGLKDEFYNRYITLGNLFEPVVNALLDHSDRCNAFKSALMELFEFIRTEDIQFLIAHIVENFSDALESLKHIHTFQGLKTKYEQEKDRQNQKVN
ncbi:P4R3B phosphatase, partial [Pomatostomus ruficeps]|nr:P4R3B phosphatase [Pomatostomus ruficeps]